MSQFRPRCDYPDAHADKHNPEPARGTYVFMQPVLGDQSEDYVAKRSGGQNVGEICPGKGAGVTTEKRNQERNSSGHPRIRNDQQYMRNIVERQIAHSLHPARQKGISDSGEQRNPG